MTVQTKIPRSIKPSSNARIFGVGSSANKFGLGADAGQNAIELRIESKALSGDTRNFYNRLYISGAGGSGEAQRNFTTVENVAAANAHGVHNSLSFGVSGTVTGQGIAGKNTLHIPETALASNVTLAALQAEIYSDAATSDPGGSTLLSALRIVNGGDATGMADVDDDAAAIEFNGWTSGSGNMIYTHAVATPGAGTGSIRIRVGSADKYLYYWDTEGST